MEATTNDQYLCFTCGTPPEEVEDREVKKSACPRARKLLQEFYDAKISLDTTFPYWYKNLDERRGAASAGPPRTCNEECILPP